MICFPTSTLPARGYKGPTEPSEKCCAGPPRGPAPELGSLGPARQLMSLTPSSCKLSALFQQKNYVAEFLEFLITRTFSLAVYQGLSDS